MTDMPRMLPMLVADERACRQMLINLLSNAIKFSHEDGTVTVSMKRQGRSLNISVTDHGIGMDARRRQPHRRAVLPGAGRAVPPLRRHGARAFDRQGPGRSA